MTTKNHTNKPITKKHPNPKQQQQNTTQIYSADFLIDQKLVTFQ